MKAGTRLRAFKAVFADALKPAPPSPAFSDYSAAKSNEERKLAYAQFTESDREAFLESVRKAQEDRERAVRRPQTITSKGYWVVAAVWLSANVACFVWSLFRYWLFWSALIGVNLVMASIFISIAYRRKILIVARAFPSAVSAALAVKAP